MFSEKLRQRLERLNRESLPATRDATDVLRTLPCEANANTAESAMTARAASVHESPSSLPGEAATVGAAEHWLIRQSVAELWPRFDERFDRWRAAQAERDAAAPRIPQSKRAKRHAAEVAALAAALPRGTLFLDLETCGLAGSMVFLIGLLRHDGDSLVLEQLLARSFAEEQAILDALSQRVAEATLLVTFNGKTFDWPLVQYRSTYHRLDLEALHADLDHVDVLHHARRRWRRRLPNCRLQTLERFLCGRHRSGDIPGRDIPEAYREYVAAGRVDQMQAILHHNALDLVTLLQLAMILTLDEPAPTAVHVERQFLPPTLFTEEAA